MTKPIIVQWLKNWWIFQFRKIHSGLNMSPVTFQTLMNNFCAWIFSLFLVNALAFGTFYYCYHHNPLVFPYTTDFLSWFYFYLFVFGARAMRDAHMVTFFFADFVTCANFSNLWGNFLKTQNRYGHHVFAKNCAGSSATYWLKKNSKKIRLHVFFERKFWKTHFLRVFYVWSPISQNQDQIQSSWFRILYKRFIGYTFAKKWRRNYFWDLVFLAKKGMKRIV